MFKGIVDTLIRLDHTVWYYLNTQWHTPFLDNILPFFRNPWFWSPLYLFLLLFTTTRFGKKGWVWCVFFIASFALSDQVSAHLMKPYFHRIRPCNDPYFAGIVHLIVPCGSGLSFPSSHAANHFCLAIFSAITLGSLGKWIRPVALLWAILVSFSQVYVGVHFPGDVTVGGIVGAIIGVVTGRFFNRYFILNAAIPPSLNQDSTQSTSVH